MKPWGKVLLEVEGRPFLVVGEVGPAKAQVFCILGTPMGELGKGRTAFWEWEDWKYLMRQIIIARKAL